MAVVTALLADEAGGGIGGAGVHLANHSAVVAVVGQQPVDQARRPEWSGRSGACAWSAGSARSGTRRSCGVLPSPATRRTSGTGPCNRRGDSRTTSRPTARRSPRTIRYGPTASMPPPPSCRPGTGPPLRRRWRPLHDLPAHRPRAGRRQAAGAARDGDMPLSHRDIVQPIRALHRQARRSAVRDHAGRESARDRTLRLRSCSVLALGWLA